MPDILNGYNETITKSQTFDYDNIEFITNNIDVDFKNDIIANLKKNISFWSNYWIPKDKVTVLHGNENDFEWMQSLLTKHNMVDGFNMKTINSFSNCGGGGITGEKLDTALFWQIIGSDIPSSELKRVGLGKLTGHLYAHIVQPGILNSFSNSPIKITSMPAWYIEGQSDYHTLCMLDGDFIENRKIFLNTAYVPDGYKEKIKQASQDDWYNILLNDSNFEGIPVTYEYWSGFLVYENLVNTFGIDKVVGLIKDFTQTMDFRESMKNILDINYKDFYLDMSNVLYDNAKQVMI